MQFSPTDSIWIPGKGEMRLDSYRVHKALQEYDERLMFGRNERTGDYCAFIKMPHGQTPVAVLGFGRQVPTVDEAMQRVREADARRYGTQIIEGMLEANRKIKDRPVDEDAQEAYAEIMEYAYRKAGLHPSPRIFVPGGK